MDREQRKELVAKILSKGKKLAAEEVEIIKANPEPNFDFMYEHIRKYVLAKFMLDTDVEETNIRDLATLSLARMMKVDKDVMHSLDFATPCDHATSESAKKVLLLYALQKELSLAPDPEKLTAVRDLTDLTNYVLEAEQE